MVSGTVELESCCSAVINGSRSRNMQFAQILISRTVGPLQRSGISKRILKLPVRHISLEVLPIEQRTAAALREETARARNEAEVDEAGPSLCALCQWLGSRHEQESTLDTLFKIPYSVGMVGCKKGRIGGWVSMQGKAVLPCEPRHRHRHRLLALTRHR